MSKTEDLFGASSCFEETGIDRKIHASVFGRSDYIKTPNSSSE